MKQLILLYAALLFTPVLFSQYKPADNGSKIEFKIKNLGFTVTGTFTGLSGSIQFDPKNLPGSRIDVSVDAASVNTDNTMRDDHLRENSYFDVKQYPRISFISTKITSARGGGFFVSGKLTIKNISKDISFPFTAREMSGGYAFKGSFTINRRDFNVGGFSVISDMLTVNFDVLALPF